MRRRPRQEGSTIPFSAEDFKYRPDEFLTSGHDDFGQSVRLFFRCPPSLERSLEVIRDTHRFPYGTVSDIIRHAVIRHAEWLHRMEPDMPRHFLGGLNAINEVCRDSEMLNQIQGTFSKLDSLIETHLATGDTLEAMRLLSMARGQLSKLPDSRWKRDFSERFSRKYARQLGSGSTPGVPANGVLVEFPGATPPPVEASTLSSAEEDGFGEAETDTNSTDEGAD